MADLDLTRFGIVMIEPSAADGATVRLVADRECATRCQRAIKISTKHLTGRWTRPEVPQIRLVEAASG
jgi:hypothetical protein